MDLAKFRIVRREKGELLPCHDNRSLSNTKSAGCRQDKKLSDRQLMENRSWTDCFRKQEERKTP